MTPDKCPSCLGVDIVPIKRPGIWYCEDCSYRWETEVDEADIWLARYGLPQESHEG